MRSTLILLHRWAGLVIALFVALAGLTGVALAWVGELDAWVAPELFDTGSTAPPLPIDVLHARVDAQVPAGLRADFAPLRFEPGRAAQFFLSPAPGTAPASVEHLDNQMFVDPATGQVLGTRRWGDITQGTKNLMPFVYKLHYAIALPGKVGTWIMGIAAVLWTIDCFVGFALTWPAGRWRGLHGSLQAWKPAWKVKWRAAASRVHYDLHRAAGLWVWALLFVFAWSGVMFNLNHEVYTPVMSAVGLPVTPEADHDGEDESAAAPGAVASATVAPNAFTWSQALARGETLMAEAASTHGFKVLEGAYLGFDARRGAWSYSAVTDQDPNERHGSSRVRFDAQTGALVEAHHIGVDTAGDRITSWIAALHMGHVFGTWYRIVVMLVGVVVVTLSVTGVVVWWNKRTVRRRQTVAGGARRRSDTAPARPGAEPTHDAGSPGLGSAVSARSTSTAR
jgi:uncharacterized iron-regulated membrane protein